MSNDYDIYTKFEDQDAGTPAEWIHFSEDPDGFLHATVYGNGERASSGAYVGLTMDEIIEAEEWRHYSGFTDEELPESERARVAQWRAAEQSTAGQMISNAWSLAGRHGHEWSHRMTRIRAVMYGLDLSAIRAHVERAGAALEGERYIRGIQCPTLGPSGIEHTTRSGATTWRVNWPDRGTKEVVTEVRRVKDVDGGRPTVAYFLTSEKRIYCHPGVSGRDIERLRECAECLSYRDVTISGETKEATAGLIAQ